MWSEALGGIKRKRNSKQVTKNITNEIDPKVSTLEERDDLKNVTMDELHGILTAYEMRIGQNGSSRKEATFKSFLKNQ